MVFAKFRSTSFRWSDRYLTVLSGLPCNADGPAAKRQGKVTGSGAQDGT